MTCPILNKRKIGEENTSGYIVQNKNDSIRLKSTSGAAVNAIAEYVISCGGVVFGCEFSDDRVCRHTMATDISDLGKFQGSKYVQSELGDCFKSIKEQLDADKKVLFIGMPCQVAGLESYIKRNKENLYLMDLACHGVPSPGVFKDFIQFLEHKYKGKISNFVFRDKTYGYSATNIKVYFANGKTIDCRNDIKTFTRLMFKGITLRPSCYECAFKTKHRVSDITIFDCALVGNIDGTGSGDRKELLKWVWKSMDNKWIGMGGSAEFTYSLTEHSGIYSYIRTKTSIENQYLNLLYHYGIIGLISAIWVYIQLLIKSVIQAVKNSSKWEGRISYPKMLAVILGTYYISFFGVHQIDEKRIFFCLIFLLIAYCNNKAYITEYEE